ncbi:FtsX-like permease family protein [Streptomyces sp. NPDC002790]|uniref:FtsX-like permease family protein n=1 Tax=Streptomyces sp. NPDC002790 TaxID=3154431 RepID=UPI0033322B2D
MATGLAIASVRHRRGGFVASFLSVFLGAAIVMAFAAMLDTAGGPAVASGDRTVLTIMASAIGGWGAIIAAFAVGTTLSVAARQRAGGLALLRSVGATPGQVTRLIMGETALVGVDVPGQLAAPVESAVYFAVNECLANVVKHSRARRAWVALKHAAGSLTVVVGDDGVGGADLGSGTGLRGLVRRLEVFDGAVTLRSPVGGPTEVTLEMRCALSSPKTSPFSETA